MAWEFRVYYSMQGKIGEPDLIKEYQLQFISYLGSSAQHLDRHLDKHYVADRPEKYLEVFEDIASLASYVARLHKSEVGLRITNGDEKLDLEAPAIYSFSSEEPNFHYRRGLLPEEFKKMTNEVLYILSNKS